MSTNYCGCGVAPSGVASSYSMTISGVSNNVCNLCAGYNTSWVMTQPPGQSPCEFTAVTNICSLGSWILTFQNDTHGNLEAVLTLGTSSGLTWTQTNLPDAFQVMS